MSETVIALSPSSFAAADDAPLRLLERAGVTVRGNPYGRRLTEDEAAEHLQGVHGLIAGLEPLTRRVLTGAGDLRAIARVGIGVDNIDHDAAAELGIAVSNTPEAPTDAVAELTLAAALALLRGLVPASEAMHDGRWEKQISPGLHGATVLLIGFGRIGRAVGERLSMMGANLLVSDPDTTGEEDVGFPFEVVSLAEGLGRAAVISLHAGGRTQIIGQAEFEQMSDGVVLLNSARAELVDETALVQALEGGKVGSAWFDVFWEEPYSGPLTRFPQVLLTPHVGTYTATCRRSMEMQAAVNVLEALSIPIPEGSD